MNKKLAHIILIFGDLLSIGGLFIGYHLLSQIQLQIAHQEEFIKYSSSMGFFIVAIGFPILHAIAIIEYFLPELIKKHKRFLTHAVIVMLISLLIVGFLGSSWINSQIENAGYIYCQKASRISAFTKNLIYTKNITNCEKLAADRQMPPH